MSTRANIIIKDDYNKLIFYRHSDGYPECTMNDLIEFCKGYNTTMRTDVMQSAGWLIIRGHEDLKSHNYQGYDWKVGNYEPTTSIHGDIEYLYTIDLSKGTLTCKDIYKKRIIKKHKFTTGE